MGGNSSSPSITDMKEQHRTQRADVGLFLAIKRNCNNTRDVYREYLDRTLAGVMKEEELLPFKKAVMACNYMQGYWSDAKFKREMNDNGFELAPDE